MPRTIRWSWMQHTISLLCHCNSMLICLCNGRFLGIWALPLCFWKPPHARSEHVPLSPGVLEKLMPLWIQYWYAGLYMKHAHVAVICVHMHFSGTYYCPQLHCTCCIALRTRTHNLWFQKHGHHPHPLKKIISYLLELMGLNYSLFRPSTRRNITTVVCGLILPLEGSGIHNRLPVY